MTTFYKNYVSLCAKNNVSLSAAAECIGFSRTAPNGWKKGKHPSDTSLHKIADYFGVTVEDLLSDKKEKPTAANGELSEDLQELASLLNGMSDEKLQMMVNYAKFLASQE